MIRSFLIAGLLLTASASAGSTESDRKEEEPGLSANAKVSCADARKTALARVPNAAVKSAELEVEDGKLVYSFDLAVRGKKGIEEVQVDAVSGQVVSVKHEDPKAEAAEKKAEQGKRK